MLWFLSILGGDLMLSVATLKNIYLKEIYDFFRDHNVLNRSVRLKADTTNTRYIKALAIINEELNSNQSFTVDDLDNFLFEQLFYSNNNYHFAYRFNNLSLTSESTLTHVESFLQSNPGLCYNKLISDNNGLDNELFTTRIEMQNNKLRSLQLLIKYNSTSTRSFPAIDMFVGVLIDLSNNLVVLKFNQNLLDNNRRDSLDILKDIKKMLKGEGTPGRVFEPLQLNITSLNESDARDTIFKLFEELSLEAEALLDAQTQPHTENSIRLFLGQMGLSDITQDYVNQIKAVIYQDISNTISESVFQRGWVFRFLFREGDTTRASSRTDDRGPIYGSKVYWHLKEIIFREREMIESGFHWYIDPNTDDFVQVRLESRNDTMVIHYYYHMRYGRKEKEEFVLRKINQYLP
jgi:hypothetical protein